MNFTANQRAIQAAHNETAGWRNDTGAHFYPSNWQHDMGNQVYHDPGRSAVEVSLPHILNIALAAAATLTVNLFNAKSNYIAANFGNNVNITVTYTNTSALVPYTYGDLLAQTLTNPVQVGMTRIQATTQAQVTQVLSLTRNPGVGKAEIGTFIPLVYPNQFQGTMTYVENAYKVDQFTLLSYSQNGATDTSVQMFFYPNATAFVERAFSNKKVVQEYARPQTGISSPVTIVDPRVAGANLSRNPGLL